VRIQLTDVFLRDGLQDEDVVVPTAGKLAVAEALVAAGLPRLEVASFVNPQKVPQMGDAAEVLAGLPSSEQVTYTSLALNGRGVARAVAAGATDVQVVASASQAHSSANAGQGIEDALESLAAEVARYPQTHFFAGISTAFTCPFEGEIDPAHLLRVVRAFQAMGVTDIGLADTLGTSPTDQVVNAVAYVQDAEPGLTYSLHLHNAHGQALDTVSAAVEQLGITRFDSALGGYGGCPFAPGAHGNIATEQLVAHLHGAGHDTGIDEARLAEAVRLARDVVACSPALGSLNPAARPA
jgi:hydroxymethylglutaryl-CoA lyase